MFEHKSTYVEFFLHADLKKQGGKILCDSYAMGGWQPITHGNLMQDGVSRGYMRGGEPRLILL